jgi:hypothetical protein
MISLLLFLSAFPAPAHALELDDSRIPAKTLATIRADLEAFERLDFDPSASAGSARLYERLFGGSRGVDARSFLEERVRWMGVETDPAEIKENHGNYAQNGAPAYLTYYYHHDVLGEAGAKPDQSLFRHRVILYDKPGVGFVTIGGAYAARDTTAIDRLDTLVHEARHSECESLPERADLAHYDKEEYLRMSQASRRCYHVHMPCPKGHALAGELACDGHTDGAYTVGFAFSREVYKNCKNCGEKEKQAALATAAEDLTRLFPDVRRAVSHEVGK